METLNNIAVEEYCSIYEIDTSFLHQLHEHELVMLYMSDGKSYLLKEQLPDVEKYIHLHYDLNINIEGIETIIHLLNRLNDSHYQIAHLQNRLAIYENLQSS